MIFAGDFNADFSLPESEPLLGFLEVKFSLRIIGGKNHPTSGTTLSRHRYQGGTTIDAVFARNLEGIEIKHFVSYLSYYHDLLSA